MSVMSFFRILCFRCANALPCNRLLDYAGLHLSKKPWTAPMNAQLKWLHSPDIHDLEKYQPENPGEFAFLLQAMVGPEGEEGEESFDIEVCTPKWLEEHYGVDDVVVGRHHLIVRKYDYERIVDAIKRFLRGCSGENWEEVGGKVARLGKWEFEDYTE